MLTIPQNVLVINALKPQTNADALTGTYINLKTAHRAWVVFHMNQVNAAQATLSLKKAMVVAGTDAVAVTETFPIFANLDCDASDIFGRAANAASYQLDVALKTKLVVFQIDPEILGAYDCLAAVVGASNVANLVSATYLIEPRYAEGENQPSVLVD
jgi:hypothetical protein